MLQTSGNHTYKFLLLRLAEIFVLTFLPKLHYPRQDSKSLNQLLFCVVINECCLVAGSRRHWGRWWHYCWHLSFKLHLQRTHFIKLRQMPIQ
jgi:hypothetical protein